MITYHISKEGQVVDILVYLYKNREKFNPPCNNFAILGKQYDLDRTNERQTKIQLGIGEYHFEYSPNQWIHIKYTEEGQPKAMSGHIDIFHRLYLKTEDEKTIHDFLNSVDEDTGLKRKEDQLNILTCDKYGDWRTFSRIPRRKLDSIYIDESLKKRLVDDIKNFQKSEDQYCRFGIPYKRCYLLTGIPGSGKTSLVKAICNEFDYNLNMLSISKDFDNSSLTQAFRFMENDSILLLEDIDSLFERRDATGDNPLLTFSHLINMIDGVLYKHGVIIFITTNHPEKLDPAMLRIGRIDMILNIDYPSKQEVERLFRDIMKDFGSESEIDDLLKAFLSKIKGNKITMSAIVNFLFRYRMNCLEHIDEILKTNNYIREITGKKNEENLYI